VIGKVSQHIQRLGIRDVMDVIEHQIDGLVGRHQWCDEVGDDVGELGLRCAEGAVGGWADSGQQPLQRSAEGTEQRRWVIVGGIHREPGDTAWMTGNPLADQRGLARARGGRQQRQPSPSALLNAFDQVRALNERWASSRRLEAHCQLWGWVALILSVQQSVLHDAISEG